MAAIVKMVDKDGNVWVGYSVDGRELQVAEPDKRWQLEAVNASTPPNEASKNVPTAAAIAPQSGDPTPNAPAVAGGFVEEAAGNEDEKSRSGDPSVERSSRRNR